ncbi:MAG: FecR family protein [Pseudomonadota bacterium]
MKRRYGMCVAAVLLSWVFIAFAAAGVGTLTQVKGAVAIVPPGKPPVVATLGDAVDEGQTVLTRGQSQAEITFADGSIMRLAANSRVRITQYQGDAKTSKSIFNLFEGKVQNIVTRAAGFFSKQNENRYEVHTPTAVCGVRGTDFFVSFIDGISESAVKSGVVYAFSANQPDEVREVKAGQSMVVVSADKPPVIRPALDKDLVLEDDDGEASGDTKVDDTQGPPPSNDPVDGDKVSDGGTIDTPPNPPSPSTDTYTLFSAALGPGAFDGTLQGSISDKTNTGTFEVNAQYAGGNTAAQRADGDMDTGGGFVGFLGGTVGSWEGLYNGIYVAADAKAGYVYSLLPGSLSGGSLSAKGPAWRTNALGIAGSGTDISAPLSTLLSGLPEIGSIGTGGGFSVANKMITGIDATGVSTGRERILSVWTLQTSGGSVDASLLGTSFVTLYGQTGSNGYTLGFIEGSDDGAGHVALSGYNDQPLTYIDSDYLGALSLWQRGTHDGDGTNYRSIEQGTATLDLMRYGGQWSGGAGTLYKSDTGSFSEFGEGSDEGLFGGFSAPWDSATVDFFAMGDYSYTAGPPATSYLLNSFLQGWGIEAPGEHDGSLMGFANGLWKADGTFAGYAASLTLAPDGRAGVMAGSLAGNWFEGVDMWSVSGTLSSSYKETLSNSASISPQWMAASGLSGAFISTATSDYAGLITGGLDDLSMFISLWDRESAATGWGIYDFRLGDGNTFQRPGDGTYTVWSARLGGRTYTSDGSGGPMFYAADLAGNWTADGEITGNLSGVYQTATHRGAFTGPVFGQNTGADAPPDESGTWIASSVGTFESQDLAWGGTIIQDENGSGLFFKDGAAIGTDGGDFSAAIGSLSAPWVTTSSDFWALGTIGSLSAPGSIHIFATGFQGSDQWPISESAADQRVVQAVAAGLWKPDGTITDVHIYGLYQTPYLASGGHAGLLYGQASGTWDDALDIWELNGDWARYASATTSIGNYTTRSATGDFDGVRLYPQFDTDITLTAPTIDTLSWNIESVLGDTIPMGIFSLQLSKGDFTRGEGVNSFTATIGGAAVFGSNDSDQGYWRADADIFWNDDGEVTGYLENGRYLTETWFGTVRGDIAGFTDPGTMGEWTNQVVGGWAGTYPLAYSGDWGDSTLYYNSEGSIDVAGNEGGIFGIYPGVGGDYELLAMGTYTDDGFGGLESGYGGPYLWSTGLNGMAVGNPGYSGGYSAGIWMKGADTDRRGDMVPGAAAMLIATPEDTVSLLMGIMGGTFYEMDATRASGIWDASATMDRAEMTVPEGYSVADAQLGSQSTSGGGLVGTFWDYEGDTGSIYGGITLLETTYIANDDNTVSLPYGVFSLRIGDGEGTGFTGKPSGDPDAAMILGGEGVFGAAPGDEGYWMTFADTYWLPYGSGDSGIIDGELYGPYLTRTHYGEMFGNLFGLFDDPGESTGTWIGAGVGIYEAFTELSYSGDIGGPQANLIGNDAGTIGSAGDLTGLLGLTEYGDGDYLLIGMGAYTDTGPGAPYLWSVSLTADTVGDSSGVGGVAGYSGGIWSGNAIDDIFADQYLYTASLVYDPLGSVHMIEGPVYGIHLAGADNSGFWILEGDLTGRDMAALVPAAYNVDTAEADRAFIGFDAYLDGQFYTEGLEGTSSAGGYTARSRFINYYDEDLGQTVSLPFGVYNIKLGDGSGDPGVFADKPEGTVDWSATLGGHGAFGVRDRDEGYWLAHVESTWYDGGTIEGGLDGNYMTYSHRGQMSGPFWGLYEASIGPFASEGSNAGTWIGLGVGSYESTQPLSFSAEWGIDGQQGMFYWDASHNNDSLYYGGFFDVADTRGLLGGIENADETLKVWGLGDFGFEENYGGANYLWAAWSQGKAVTETDPDLYGVGAVGAVDDQGLITGAMVAIRSSADGSDPALYTGRIDCGQAYYMNDGFLAEGPGGYWDLEATLLPGMDGFSNYLSSSGIIFQEGSYGGGPGTITLSEIAWESVPTPGGGGPTSATAVALAGIASGFGGDADTPWQLSLVLEDADTLHFIQVMGDDWGKKLPADPPINRFGGDVNGAWVHWDDGMTGVMGGELKGLFDPADPATWASGTWVAGAATVSMDTPAYLASVRNGAHEVLDAMNIPSWEVGNGSLSGNDGNLYVTMNNITFFAASAMGTPPTVWATDAVSGFFGSTPAVTDTVPLTGFATANFVVQNWAAGTGGTWGATVESGSGSVAAINESGANWDVSFNGAAAGQNTSDSTFTGTGAGVVTNANLSGPE